MQNLSRMMKAFHVVKWKVSEVVKISMLGSSTEILLTEAEILYIEHRF